MPRRKVSQKTVSKPSVLKQSTPVLEEVVDPRWLLRALGMTAVAAVICAWLVLCLLYYQGSWQLVLRPSHKVDRTPAAADIPFEDVRFNAAETGQARLRGWWVPASAARSSDSTASVPKYADDAILLLHDGSDSLSATLPTIELLHGAGINVFAFDYRGFGESDASLHPTSASMTADSMAALNFLNSTRHIPRARVVPYGIGLGGSLAVALATSESGMPAVIVDNPDPDPTRTAVGTHPSRIVPIRLLYHEHFEIAELLRSLRTPKLLLSGGPNARASEDETRRVAALFRDAGSPAISVSLPRQEFQTPYVQAVTRFLDQYLRAASSRDSLNP